MECSAGAGGGVRYSIFAGCKIQALAALLLAMVWTPFGPAGPADCWLGEGQNHQKSISFIFLLFRARPPGELRALPPPPAETTIPLSHHALCVFPLLRPLFGLGLSTAQAYSGLCLPPSTSFSLSLLLFLLLMAWVGT